VFNNAAVYAAKQDIADYVLSDGNSFEVDNIHVQVISTPGHADDSVCFLIDGKYLFVGDNMSLRDGNVGLFNSIYNKSDEQQIADIKKLSGLSGIEYIFTAHYGFTDNPAY
jgi:glyoxylase-like metal-dependent hydrolase (beta-lactamase superfamily II)